MRRAAFTVLVTVAIACSACQSTDSDGPSPTSGNPVVGSVPPGVPDSFESDADASELPVPSLVPEGSEVTGTWAAGDALVLSYTEPSSDPLRSQKGLVVWRRFPSSGTWRPVVGFEEPRPVISLDASTGDATGDGFPDVLSVAISGGSGACGTWRLIDVANAKLVYRLSGCDTQVSLSRDEPGLVVTQAIYRPGDAHCCPSRTRTTTLSYNEHTSSWAKVSKEMSQAG